MSGNLRILHKIHSDDMIFSASPSLVATLPEENLQNPTRGSIARSTTAPAAQEIKGTFATAKIFSGLVLWRNNLTTDATWRLQLYSDEAWSVEVYDSGAVAAIEKKTLGDLDWGEDPLGASVFVGWDIKHSVMWFDPIGAKSFKLTIADSGNADGYIQASRLILGSYLQAQINVDWGNVLTWQRTTRQFRTGGGSLRSDPAPGGSWREMRIRHKWLSEVDRPKFFDLGRTPGLDSDLFVSMFPDESGSKGRDFSFVAKITQAPGMTMTIHQQHSQPLVFQET